MTPINRFTAHALGWYLLSLVCSPGFAQTPTQRLDQWTTTSTPEKIYLHTDKPYYAIGDTIWLSAFVVTGVTHRVDGSSRVAYAQLLDSYGDPVAQRVLRLTAGRGQADMALPDSLPEGDYQLVAFTNWMRNAPDDFFFHQNIHLWRTRPAAKLKPVPPLPLDLQFFPEGGQLVAGLPCRMAFKVLNSRGQSLAIQGTITDTDGQTVSIPFRTTHNGMGLFFLTPQAGKHYTATLSDGSTYPLPAVQSRGVGFWVDNTPSQRVVRATVYKPANATGDSKLIAHLRGQVCFEALVPNATKITALIPYDKIPADGLLTLTLFDEHQQPLCERLVLINQHRQLNISTTFDKTQYGPHDPVTMQIAVTDSAGRPVPADLSLAVTDATRVVLTTPQADNLLSNLLLTSDLSGYVEQPAYYFDPTEPNAARDADLLLMTQGWRRFTWQQPNPTPAFHREDGLTLTGRVLRLNKTPLPTGQAIMILSSGIDSRFATVGVDSAGRFAITDVDLPGDITVVAKGLTQNSRQARSCVLDPLLLARAGYQVPPAHDSLLVPALFLRAEQERFQMAAQYRFTSGRTLSEVQVKAQRKEPYWTDSRRVKLGEPDAVSKQGNTPANTYLDILRQSQAGNRAYNKLVTNSAPVYVFVDGVSVAENQGYNYTADPMLLGALLPDQIAQIDIISNPAKIAVLGGTGVGQAFGNNMPMVINILTKRGDYTGSPTGLSVRQVAGYARVREFYVPKYGPDTSIDPKQPDSRTTLFWTARLQTDNTGKATITFPNNDHATRLRATVNGLSPDGRAGSAQTETPEKQ